MFYVLLYVTLFHSSIAIMFMGKRELVALLNMSSWCLLMVEGLFLPVPWGCLRFVIVVFPSHTHYFRITEYGVSVCLRVSVWLGEMVLIGVNVGKGWTSG